MMEPALGIQMDEPMAFSPLGGRFQAEGSLKNKSRILNHQVLKKILKSFMKLYHSLVICLRLRTKLEKALSALFIWLQHSYKLDLKRKLL